MNNSLIKNKVSLLNEHENEICSTTIYPTQFIEDKSD